MPRIHNFNPGPSTLPIDAMEHAQAEFIDYRGLGYGIIEASHRSPEFEDVINLAELNIRKLLTVPDSHSILFLQGGASLQFAMAPMNLGDANERFDYALTGSWSEKAVKEAEFFGSVQIVASSKNTNYDRIPPTDSWDCRSDAAYLHITSNNTIFGTQFHQFPHPPERVPLIADMSSDILSKTINVGQFGLIYAGAQKNLGPSGVTIVVIDNELAERGGAAVPKILRYSTHIAANSLYNTPPTFGVYMIALITQHMIDNGGMKTVEAVNEKKARLLYEVIDEDDFYRCPAASGSRSKMNVCFRIAEDELESRFIESAAENGMIGLKGHRSVGGIRASVYNAMTLEGVQHLRQFMVEFRKEFG